MMQLSHCVVWMLNSSCSRNRVDATELPKDQSEIETKFAWDRRIFQERSQSLTYVCEVPQLLEQRLGEIARMIQARL